MKYISKFSFAIGCVAILAAGLFLVHRQGAPSSDIPSQKNRPTENNSDPPAVLLDHRPGREVTASPATAAGDAKLVKIKSLIGDISKGGQVQYKVQTEVEELAKCCPESYFALYDLLPTGRFKIDMLVAFLTHLPKVLDKALIQSLVKHGDLLELTDERSVVSSLLGVQLQRCSSSEIAPLLSDSHSLEMRECLASALGIAGARETGQITAPTRVPEDLKRAYLKGVINFFATTDPRRFLQMDAEHAFDDYDSSIGLDAPSKRIIQESGFQEFSEFIQSLPSVATRTRSYKVLIDEWLRIDSIAASKWASELPVGNERAAVAERIVSHLRDRGDVIEAKKWDEFRRASLPSDH